jgi:hypothetical protein
VDETWSERMGPTRTRYTPDQEPSQPLGIMQPNKSRTRRDPWENAPQTYRRFICFALWVFCIAVNAAMACMFSILFTYFFLGHLWRFCLRALFSKDW